MTNEKDEPKKMPEEKPVAPEPPRGPSARVITESDQSKDQRQRKG